MKLLTVFVLLFVFHSNCVESQRYEKSVPICDRNRPPNNTVYRLPKTVTPIKYRIRFRSDLNTYKFYGTEIIQVVVNNRTDIIELNAVDLQIDNVWFQTRRLRGETIETIVCLSVLRQNFAII